jgi:hypothetical protein
MNEEKPVTNQIPSEDPSKPKVSTCRKLNDFETIGQLGQGAYGK